MFEDLNLVIYDANRGFFFLLIKLKFVFSDEIKEKKGLKNGKIFYKTPEESFLITSHILSPLGICIVCLLRNLELS